MTSTGRYDALLADLANRWPVVAATALVLVAALVLPPLLRKNPLAAIPAVKGGRIRWVRQGWAMYIEGYNKFKGGVFTMQTARSDPIVLISPKYLPELKKLPNSVLSFGQAVDDSMHTKYTGMDSEIPLLVHTVKSALTPALGRLNDTILDEVVESMRLELPQTGTWTEVNINQKLLRVVAMVSGRIFVGSELCREEEYLDASINYTLDVMKAVVMLTLVPGFLRPLVAGWLPQVRTLYRRIDQAIRFLRPIVASRQAAAAADGPDYRKPDDMLQWMIDSQARFGGMDELDLAKTQLAVSFAAIHTTTITTTNAIYCLSAMPELIPTLRDDIQEALLESGGQFTSAAMQKMRKLDSFLAEVARFYPLSATSFRRKVLQPVTLSSGEVVPAGVCIEIPAAGINSDEDIYENADEFDALRFYKLRLAKDNGDDVGPATAEVAANNQFISVSAATLTFGYGRHACPGRFFAVNEIKMILANFILYYEVKNVDGHPERYPNKKLGNSSVPDGSRTIMIRKL